MVIIDEAHRMSAWDEAHKSQRYKLGELLRDSAEHILLLTATPHKGDPKNFTLFLQLLDQDAYADVKSIQEAMDRRRAPFYLRRTKEAMVYFPEKQEDGTWRAKPVFTKRIPRTASFDIDGPSSNSIRMSPALSGARVVAQPPKEITNPRARAVGFLMCLYQRRLASSVSAMRRSLENRAKRLEKGLGQALELVKTAPPDLSDLEELEEYEDTERERLEELLDAITLAENADQAREEIAELRELAAEAKAVENSGSHAKLERLRKIMRDEGFFDHPEQRLLIFTEFKDTLNSLMDQLKDWGFKVGCIYGGMNPGSRMNLEPGSSPNSNFAKVTFKYW